MDAAGYADRAKKPLIVISYAHADEPEKPAEGEVKWLSFVTGYLRPAIKQGAVELFLDRLMPGGADWEREIAQKLRACDIFILLVSRHSLSSDYIVDKEITIIRERQAKGEDVHFYPLVLTPTPKIALDLVREKNLRPRDGKPLSDYSVNERYRQMSDAADEIAGISAEDANRFGGRHEGTNPWAGSALDGQHDRKSFLAWLRGQKRAVLVAIAARAALRAVLLESKQVRSETAFSYMVAMNCVLRACALARVVANIRATRRKSQKPLLTHRMLRML